MRPLPGSGARTLQHVSGGGMLAAILVSSVAAFALAAVVCFVGAYLVAPDADQWDTHYFSMFAQGALPVGVGVIVLSLVISFGLLSWMKRKGKPLTKHGCLRTGMTVPAFSVVPAVLLGNYLFYMTHGTYVLAPSGMLSTAVCLAIGMAPFGWFGAAVLLFILERFSAQQPVERREQHERDGASVTKVDFQPTLQDHVECTHIAVSRLRRLMRSTWPSAGYVVLNWCAIAVSFLGLLVLFSGVTSNLAMWAVIASMVISFFIQPRLNESWRRLAASYSNSPTDEFAARSCVIDENGITFTSSVEAIQRKWPTIQSIERIGNQILFFVNNAQADFVPRRAFSSEEMAGCFLATAQRFWRNATDRAA